MRTVGVDLSAERCRGVPGRVLHQWELPHRGYKGSAHPEARNDLVDQVQQRAPWLDLGLFEATCRSSDHALDAVVAALSARAAAIGRATTPNPDQAAIAAIEGWIAVPDASFDRLR